MRLRVNTSVVKVQIKGANLKVQPQGPPIKFTMNQSKLTLSISQPKPIVVKVGIPGLTGPPGPKGDAGPPGVDGDTPDLVCVIKPDSTLSYVAGLLDRVDYVGGRYKTLAYDSVGQLITVACVDPSIPETVTKTLGYTSGLLTSVTTVVT